MAERTDTNSDDPRADSANADVVDLDLPLTHRHASTVRVVTAALAADAGFTVDEIEDFRLGVNEAVSVLADVEAGDGARLHLRFSVADAAMTVVARRVGVVEQITIADVDDLAVRILRAVVDDFRVDDEGGFVVVKHAAADGD